MKIIFTVDCGTLSYKPIEEANKKEIDVIVLDHHQSDIKLPNACAIINPNRYDDTSKLNYLCAAGVCFMYLVGLNKKETAEKFGKEQVHIWRRSYDTPPPNGESLKDVVERVGPYYEQNIQPLINEKKNVIIVAHGNSLRATMIQVGLYKPEEISNIELPTGSPFCIVFTNSKLENSFYLS